MHKAQAFIYYANGEIVPVLPQNKKSFTLSEIQRIVGDHFSVHTLPDGRLMIQRNTSASKRVNFIATVMAGMKKHISGDVLVTPTDYI
jgi:hypothetical protein